MKRRSTAAPIAVCVLVLLAPAASAEAQTEFYGGYSYLQDPGNAVLAITARDNRFPAGWAAGAARPLWRWIDAVAEASGHYKRRAALDDTVRVSYHTLMTGPRGALKLGKLTEFAQVLAGVAHGRATAFGATARITAFAVQPGGGLDYTLAARLAARVELDYRWIRNGADGREHASQFRAVAALVYR